MSTPSVYFRLVKESDGHQILGTSHEDTARTIAQGCSLSWRKNIAVIRVSSVGNKSESETIASYKYRRLLHEDQSYDSMSNG